MNLVLLDKAYTRIKKIEEYDYHKYEPKSKLIEGPRHIYYNDLRKDFVEELNTYGFSPYIQSKLVWFMRFYIK